MKNFIQEFKTFAVKGNMIDMAIGIIIGTAFNKVVNTLVKKIIMPPLSLLSEGVTLSDKKVILREAREGAGEVAIWYGELVEVLIDFGIISLTIFVVLKFINHFKDKAEDPEDEIVQSIYTITLSANPGVTISNPEQTELCSGDQYEILNLPTNASVSWSSSFGTSIQINSDQSVTISSANINATATIELNNACIGGRKEKSIEVLIFILGILITATKAITAIDIIIAVISSFFPRVTFPSIISSI